MHIFRPTDIFWWFVHIWHIFWSLKWSEWFCLKNAFLLNWAYLFVARNKKFKIFSECSFGPQVHSTILLWHQHLIQKLYVCLYVKNGTFLSFENSAGVLVQTWTWIFMSKFELFPVPLKKIVVPGFSQNYIYFNNI